MITALAAGLVATALSAPPPQAPPRATVRRLMLIAAANRGGEDRPVLKYALSDAERFSQVMQAIGGTSGDDVVLLKQPRVGDLDAALAALRQRVLDARRAAGADGRVRTEVFFYYSGHADDKGLLLGNDRLSYGTLRERLDAVPADVRIGVLDACASGAVTRPKGGKVRSPFTVDQSSDMRGHAFLTSSSADESAQESDRLGASFFTHYLISGLRGAADVTGDGRVTLNEAYQFAFTETLSRTVGTKGGPQHPVYDITMSGTGDVIVTDLRHTAAGFIVAAPVEGRFYVLDGRQRLVVEFNKTAGRRVDVGLEAGPYEIRYERPPKAWRARVDLKDGARPVLDLAAFGPASLEFTRLRGVDTTSDYVLAGRHQAGFMLGMWNAPDDGTTVSMAAPGFTGARVSAGQMSAGFEYLKFVRDDLALGASVRIMVDSIETTASPDAVNVRDRVGLVLPFVVRWNPIRPFTAWRAAEPYVFAAAGPLFGAHNTVRTTANRAAAASETVVNTTVAGRAGAGVDIRVGRSWITGVSAAYNASGNVRELGVAHTRYTGWEVSFGVARLFGAHKLARR